MQTVIFDLDGTLANIEHRRWHLNSIDPDWRSFNLEMANDLPNRPIVDLYKTLWESGAYLLIIVSGRSEEFRGFTEQWLVWNEISYSDLIMRQKYDFRADYLIKEDILKKLLSKEINIAFVVDDRQQVVDMWRRHGVTCLQCDIGNF